MNTSKTRKVSGVDLPVSAFAYVGDESDPATWKLPIHFPGDETKTVNLIRSALHHLNKVDVADAQRHTVRLLVLGAAIAHGVRVDRSLLTQSNCSTGKVAETQSAEAKITRPEPEPVKVEPAKPEVLPPATVTVPKDSVLEALVAESDRRAEMWLRILNLD